jgi:hypothetical protein
MFYGFLTYQFLNCLKLEKKQTSIIFYSRFDNYSILNETCDQWRIISLSFQEVICIDELISLLKYWNER